VRSESVKEARGVAGEFGFILRRCDRPEMTGHGAERFAVGPFIVAAMVRKRCLRALTRVVVSARFFSKREKL
jgi:hypothetical protein